MNVDLQNYHKEKNSDNYNKNEEEEKKEEEEDEEKEEEEKVKRVKIYEWCDEQKNDSRYMYV